MTDSPRPDPDLACHDYGPDPLIRQLEDLYAQAMTRSGLPYRSPSHRICEQLSATAEAAAYANVLALLTDTAVWKGRAAERARNLRDRCHTDQSEIDSADRAESKLRRYGLR